MQPMGRKPYKCPGKTDAHPRHGYVNWWEIVIQPNKTAAKILARRDIEEETNDAYPLEQS